MCPPKANIVGQLGKLDMPEYIQSGVRKRCDNPSSETEVALIVGIENTSEEQVIEQIQQLGGEIEERLPYNFIAASILEQSLEELCSIDGIESVEVEGESRVLEEGNFRSHTDSIL